MVSSGRDAPNGRVLERMAAGLSFRGPDATQVWTRPDAGFCFALLRTGPAPQSSGQPCTLDGKLWLLGDIRLDGRADLQRQLERGGDPLPRRTTDEELVLRAWRQRGEACLESLLGDFSFALWDEEARELFCVRDFVGLRPFFYARLGAWFCFSNTLEVLRIIPEVSSSLDMQYVGDFLLQESCGDASRTAYRDIRRLPAGHLLKYSGTEPCVRRHTELPIEDPLRLKPREHVESFQGLLRQAVRDRLPRAPAAILLSGGLDSTSIAAVATNGARKDSAAVLRAFTVDSRPLFDDQEAVLASSLARLLQIDIRVASGGLFLPYEGWDDAELRTPEPVHEPFLALSYKLQREICGVARVVFTGYGGDDILTGQAWPYLVYLLRRWRLDAIVGKFGGYILKHRRIPPLRGGFRTRLRRWTRGAHSMAAFPGWLEPRFVEDQHLRERWSELQQERATRHPLHPMAHAALSDASLSSTFETDDAAWTGVAVETRAPLLDLRLLRFLLRVPPVPWCMEKELLREAMRGILPESIRVRPKTPLPIEPLDALIERRAWSPLTLPEPTERLRTFVDCRKLRATLQTARGSQLWASLRPVSLSHWLKGVEKREWIG